MTRRDQTRSRGRTMTRGGRTRLRRLVALSLGITLAGGVAWGYWAADSTPGGNGASAATVVNQGATPTASAAGNAVTVSWAASTLANGNPVDGYQVTRYDFATLTAQTILSACTGTVTATTCVENSVPTGQWVYSVTPVFASNWTGAESANSSPVTVGPTDTTAPVNAVTLSVVTGNAVKTGDTIYYRGAAAGSVTLTNAVSDSGSGPASSTTGALTGTSTGWTHTPSTVSTPTGGPYVSNPFNWAAATTTTPGEVVTGRDVANNTDTTTLSFVDDSTGPTGGSVDATGLVGTGSRYSTSTVLSLDLATGTDPRGVAATGAQLLRATATLTSAGGTADGVCGTFGTYTLITGGTDPVSPKSDTVSDQACYSYQYVVADTLGNPTTYTSPAIKVDSTVPATPTLAFSAFTNTYWTGTGSTVYYRSAASPGAFTATATATDTASGITGYAFPTLGTNWTSTPGAAGVNTYSWTGTPAAPGTNSVTATNNATGTSAGGSFTLTADDTAPSAGTVTYANTTTTATTISVSFTTGTDGGSGIGTRLLQRATATLTGGTTCGTFGAYSTVTNGTNPTSPLVDTVGGDTCYMYQYVVSDNIGNQTTATSANIVKDTASYLNTILGSLGLVNYWRLGEATVSSDTFTGSTGTKLHDHTGEIGAGWTNVDRDAVLTSGGRVRRAGGDPWALYYSSGTPASADYTVEADVYVASNLTNDVDGITGRHSTGGAFYAAVYEQPTQTWVLYRVSGSTKTSLGSSSTQSLTAGTTYRLALDMNGSTIRLLVDGVERVSVTSTTITATGKGGVTLGFVGTPNFTVSDSTGMQLDNFRVTPPLADSKGTNTGDYLSGPTLGVTGAITGDSNKAATFDGVNDFATVARQISDDFSIELWFKSSQGIGTGTGWWQGAGLVDAEGATAAQDFGISLRSDGKVVAGVGAPVSGQDVSIVSTSGSYNNNAWHHVVFTRTMTSGAMELYVDGVSAGSATGNTASLTSPTTLNFGRIQTGNSYFAGSMDEVAVYSTAMSGSTATTHFNASK